MSNNKDFKVKNGLAVGGTIALGAIDTSISDTAVDVFVYDTSKDSDGGAWRKRTQHTSWYNETLNTSTRGSRKEFPAVAVIVAESNQVTIYDGDDPSMPMWMVFNTATGNYFWSGRNANSVVMLNGMLSIGTTAGVIRVNFVSECASNTDYYYVHTFSHPIVNRNSAANTVTASATGKIVNTTINDVAMTVLPNAPIDSATNLPIPTIAVATNGGVSVIKDDGSVVDLTSTQGSNYNYASHIEFYGDKLIFGMDSGSITSRRTHYFDIPSSDRTFSVNGDSADELYATDAANANVPDSIGGVGTYSSSMSAGGAIAGDYGLNIIDRPNHLFTFVTSDYNTGWMNGDIKLAALSDTDDTDVVGSGELVTNGDFSNGTTGWTAEKGATLSIDSGRLKISGGTTNYPAASQSITTVVGKTYVVEVTIQIDAASTAIIPTIAGATIGGWFSSVGTETRSFTLVATSTSTKFLAQLGSDDNKYAYIDNISVRLAEPDRSVNNNGLQVHGTIDKDPVATGADLVAYSGFSNSNYLQQPYNADLDFTGDFSVSAWVNWDGSTNSFIVERGTTSSNNSGLGASYNFRMNSDGTLFFIHTPNGYSSSQYLYGSTVPTNTPVHVSAVRDGSTLSLYINGKLDSSLALTSVYDLTNTNAILNVGNNITASSSYMRGSLALLRISATAPSAEQIAKIYEDERHLFTEGAKATLYGTSDAVTALAHDDDTNLLHVGTSAGRSVFQGLKRVDNTTDAVGTAISASNDLVVEE